MRNIASTKITEAVACLCARANFDLRADVLSALHRAQGRESDPRARRLLKMIIENAAIARRERLAICQDTGLPIVFVELGQEVRVSGSLSAAIQQGVARGYRRASLRNSIVRDPLLRGKPGYAPAIIHIDIVAGSRLKLTVLPKGFGCENKSRLKMFNPTVGIEAIKEFVIDSVRTAGADACPPYIVGVGIGGSADYAGLLAKRALLKKLNARRTGVGRLEAHLLAAVNRLGIGPMGLGGRITALAVHIETHPTHIAGLPVAVNISCHALRSAMAVL